MNRSGRPRSGYAFSHEHGFGGLITTGRMSMRRQTPQHENNAVEEIDTLSRRVGNEPLPNSIPTPNKTAENSESSAQDNHDQIDVQASKNSNPIGTYKSIPM